MKYRLLLTLITFTFFMTTSAQKELKVKSFLPSVNDLTARTEIRNDNGGEPCALVKVVLTDKNVSFECGNLASMIIGDVTFHTNEYWVYLAAGTGGAKHLKVKHPNYPTIDVVFADYGFSTLEPLTTYTLIIKINEEINPEYKYNRAGAAFTSLALPGLGQMVFKNSYKKGALILAGETMFISGSFLCHSQSRKWRNNSNMAISAVDKKEFMAKSDNWANCRNICIGTVAAIWVYNMADVIFAPHKRTKSNKIVVNPYYEKCNNKGICFAYRF